jgi:hypothetical protein
VSLARRESGRLWPAVFWLCFAAVAVLALLPREQAVALASVGDKFQHIMAFATLALLGRLAFPRLGGLRLLLGLSLFGALIEVLQAIPWLHRDSDPIDWIADTLAAGTVLALMPALSRLLSRGKP